MEMIIQNETGNFTLHVRISDSKEYDFLKNVTELARKYDFEMMILRLKIRKRKQIRYRRQRLAKLQKNTKDFYIFVAKNVERQSRTTQKSQRHSTNVRNADT